MTSAATDNWRKWLSSAVAAMAVNAGLVGALVWLNRATRAPMPDRVSISEQRVTYHILRLPREPVVVVAERPKQVQPPPPLDTRPAPTPLSNGATPALAPVPTHALEPLPLFRELPARVAIAVPEPAAGWATVVAAVPAADAVDTPPREIINPPPRYPRIARARGLEGQVTVKLLIAEDGTVETVEVVSVQGYTGFRRAVLDSVARWRFSPAKHRGRPVKVWGVKTIRFRLEE